VTFATKRRYMEASWRRVQESRQARLSLHCHYCHGKLSFLLIVINVSANETNDTKLWRRMHRYDCKIDGRVREDRQSAHYSNSPIGIDSSRHSRYPFVIRIDRCIARRKPDRIGHSRRVTSERIVCFTV